MLIHDQIDEMEALIGRAAVRAPEVSGWSVGQQIEHCCLTMRTTAAATARMGHDLTQVDLTAFGRLVFSKGRIPRGQAQAPQVVRVETEPSREQLTASIIQSRSAVDQLLTLEGRFFRHPLFGVLDHPRTIRFIEIHNAHHLAIVRDIVASS